MAIAVDPDTQRPRGLVTLKDLVEPITGELAAW
jgi:CBS domain containing-hemolysin-like protein